MARRFATWTVGLELGFSDGFDWEQTPESVLAELTRYLTDPRVLDGRTFFSCGVWALPEGADNITEVDGDDPAVSTYMQVGGRCTDLTLEARVTDEEGHVHYVVAHEPVQDPEAWVELSWDVGGGSTYTTRLHPEEILTGEQAVPFFRDYVLDGALPSPELLRRVRV